MDSVEHWAVVKISSLLLPIFRKISRNWPLRRTRTKWTIFSNSRLVNSGEIAIVDCPYITNWLSRAYSFSRSEIIRRSIPQWHSWQIWMVKAGMEINDSDWLNKDKILLRGIPAGPHDGVFWKNEAQLSFYWRMAEVFMIQSAKKRCCPHRSVVLSGCCFA